MTNDRVWANVHDDAPTDSDGRPIHPEKGYQICGYEKTDATDKNGNKREDIPYCLQSAGWGTDRSTGHCKAHGGAGGAPEGWKNGNARHLLFSKRMNDDDREEFEALVETADGERIGVEEMAEMLETMIGFEYMRLSRAVDAVPDVELVEKYECPKCGETYTKPLPPECTGFDMTDGHPTPCEARAESFNPGDKFVAFGDKAVERKEGTISNLIETYKKITEGQDVNVSGEHKHEHSTDDPVEVSINSVALDLPDDDSVDGVKASDGESGEE